MKKLYASRCGSHHVSIISLKDSQLFKIVKLVYDKKKKKHLNRFLKLDLAILNSWKLLVK